MYNENQPRMSDGRFGAVPHAESDDELSADAQLPEWQVLELARPGGKTHTVRAADPITARSLVLNDVSTKGRHGERAASLLGPVPCRRADRATG